MSVAKSGRKALSVLAAGAIAASLWMVAPPANAVEDPQIGGGVTSSPLPETVSADALPTVQIDNGVVWTQVIVGDTVYAAGQFSNVRPAGAAPGTSLSPRGNIVAYKLSTGELIASFAPVFNNRINELVASPDGTKLYVTGSFTQVNGANRTRFAVINIPSGTLAAGTVSLNNIGKAVYATANAVYVGGYFTAVGTQARQRIAALDPTGTTVLPFAVPVDTGQVQSIVTDPSGSQVVLAGNFLSVGGGNTPGYGLYRADAATGAGLPLPVNTEFRDAGESAGVMSLATDGTKFYGTGWVYGAGGNSEGTFSASWSDGSMVWLEDCHGDTYHVAVVNNVVYSASHKHYCGNSGGFPQTTPWSFNHSTAWTTDVRGTNTADIYGYPDHPGTPRPQLLNWYPQTTPGTFTGQSQAVWTVTGNSQYVIYGGEFPSVNGMKQQGLVRYAVRSIAPNKEGPRLSGANWNPNVLSYSSGQVRVSFSTNWDRDDRELTYRIYRDTESSTPVYQEAIGADFWAPVGRVFTDTGRAPGSSVRYRVTATDPYGNVAKSSWVTVTVSDATPSDYAAAVLKDAQHYWRLSDASVTSAVDWAGTDDLTVNGTVTSTTGAITGDTDSAKTFTPNAFAATSTPTAASNSFTAEAWIKTTTTTGGKIVGFGGSKTGNSGSYDRHVYMDNAGRLHFGVYPGGVREIASSASFNDGQWHQIVASLGDNGMNLYVDGKSVASRADTTSGQVYNGYWRIGGDTLNGWPSQPTSAYFAGDIDDVSIYGAPLPLSEIRAHYTASGRTVDVPPVPSDAYGALIRSGDPALYWRYDEANGSALTDTSEGSAPGQLDGNYVRTSPGALADGTGSAVSFDAPNGGNAYSSTLITPPTSYSVESWFKTTSVEGGKIIGFGSSQTGASASYDRHVYMQNDGKLVFGTWTGQANTVTSNASYNNGQWHHVVASQGADGMRLYVDGVLLGTNPQSGAQPYNGYWRVGGDTTWGSSSPNLVGSFDETAVYNRVLTSDEVAAHYAVGSTGSLPNIAPTANLVYSINHLVAKFQGSSSTDADGTIASYLWSFGDGTTSTEADPEHTYGANGSYDVTLTVTDNDGATGTTDATVAVVANVAPVAVIGWSATGLNATFSSSGSGDVDGTIASYLWNFGDGTTSTDTAPSHTYLTPGTRAVTLTVTDDDGAATTQTAQVVVATLPNVAPTAEFTSAVSGLKVSVDASASADPDGTITSYAWAFGTDGVGTGAVTDYTFTQPGTYTVVLTVTDDQGATAQKSVDITVTAPPANVAPTADFTPTVSGLVVSVDAAASTDSDGSIVSYAWDFSGGQSASGVTASNTYASAGTYAVTLTVTDNGGATATKTLQVTVAPAPTGTLFADSFGRQLASGWGTADSGGAWTLQTGANRFSVANGAGTITLPRVTTAAANTAVINSLSTRFSGTFSVDKINEAMYIGLVARKVDADQYMVRIRTAADGKARLQVLRGTSTGVGAAVETGIAIEPGAKYKFVVVATTTGSTAISAKIWKDGTAEPAWQIERTNTVAGLQVPGSAGIYAYVPGSATNLPVSLTFDDFVITDLNAPGGPVDPTNQAPTAAFTSTVDGLTASLDASTSTDIDGSITSYAWNFGDGRSATGVTTSNKFAAAGTYVVSLTVTDNKGATAVKTISVTVTAPPVPNVVPVAAFTSSAAGLVASVDASASTDPDGSIVSYAWDFGDGHSATGATASNAYVSKGTYTITLTVTDNSGATASKTAQVTVDDGPAPVGVLFADTFARQLATGWGTADTGGDWTLRTGASTFAVADGVGTMTIPRATSVSADTPLINSLSTQFAGSFSSDQLNEAMYIGFVARRVGTDQYMVRIRVGADGTARLNVLRGASTPIGAAVETGIVIEPGAKYHFVVGTTTVASTVISAKIWKDGTDEPAWQVERTDSTAGLQAAGTAGIYAYVPGSATKVPVRLSFDDLAITALTP